MNARRLLIPAVSVAAAAALLVPSGAADARATSVTVANMAFTPASIGTTVGGTVTWSFQDSMAHTTTSDQGFWDSGAKASGTTYTRTSPRPGPSATTARSTR
jgi:plastocyanin